MPEKGTQVSLQILSFRLDLPPAFQSFTILFKKFLTLQLLKQILVLTLIYISSMTKEDGFF